MRRSPRTPSTARSTRRDLLAAVGGAAAVGASVGTAGCLSLGGDDVAVTVDTLDARGSEAGRQRVPVPDTPTIVDLFATWCAPCADQMESLAPVHAAFGDRAAFVSVTNERLGGGLTEDDVRDWWVEHDGNWTVGHDPESDLMAALGADTLPFLAVADETGEVVWTHRGVASESTLREQVAAVTGDG